MSGIEDHERMDEGDFADFLADEVFGSGEAKPDPEPDNLESQVVPEVEEPEEEDKILLPDPAFEDRPETEQIEQPGEEPASPETVEEPEYAVWARKQFGDELDLSNPQIAKIAESRYEAEKMIGKSQSELQEQRKLMEEESAQRRIASLSQRADLTEEESDWVDVAIESEDPAAYAVSALENDRRDLYGAILDRWATQGESQSAKARDLHARVVQAYSQPAPDPQAQFRDALAQSFSAVGLNVGQHGSVILAKASELGDANPYVQGMMSQDPNIQQMAVRAIWDLAQSTQVTVQKVAREDDVAARVAEERLREGAAVVGNGTVHQTPPKTQGGFWDEFDEEVSARGWDGARPGYKEQK
jgi:hypothetical protein